MPDDETLKLLREVMGDLPVVRFTTREASTPDEAALWAEEDVVVNPPDLGRALTDAFARAKPKPPPG